jgi:Na+-translocating ferredoxin:NAD+ oxidoreductase RnfE subunit
MNDELRLACKWGLLASSVVLVKVKVKVFPVYTMNAYQGSGLIVPLITNLGTK